jgi:peptidoglycan/xylan/chitin deacetylase (PgdA/CDA1 family)
LIASFCIVLIILYYSYRYAWWRKAIDYNYPRILMYHMVREPITGKKFNSLRVSPAKFEKQIAYLAQNGWQSFTMSEVMKLKDKLPPKSVVVTFDDGYRDNLINALPILQKYNFKATIYLVVDRHDRDWSGQRKAKNVGAGLKDEPKLSDDEVKELIESGLVEIGAHTITHANLSRLTQEQKEYEIYQSKKEIEEKFAIECESFAYPFGIYDDMDREIVEKSGYKSAVTTKVGIADIKSCDAFEIPRITVSGKDNLIAFKLKLKSAKRGVKK